MMTPSMERSDLFPCDAAAAARRLDARRFRMHAFRGDDSHLHFELALSDRWVADQPHDAEASEDGFRAAATLRHVNCPSARIGLSAATLPREVHAADWLDLHLAFRRQQLLARREFRTPIGLLPDALTVEQRDGTPLFTRWTALKDGERMFVLHARGSEDAYRSLADEFLLCLASFRLVNPEGAPFTERLVAFQWRRPAFRFVHPDSWRARMDASIRRGMRRAVFLANEIEEQLAGLIVVDVAARRPGLGPRQHAEQVVARFQTEGLDPGPIDLQSAEGTPWLSTRWSADVPLRTTRAGLGLSLDVFEHPAALAGVALLAHERDSAAGPWAVNRRAVEIVRESLQIGWT